MNLSSDHICIVIKLKAVTGIKGVCCDVHMTLLGTESAMLAQHLTEAASCLI